ncbi:MAG TPA: isoprenylcysteine carboxylmethyltransferase family protein [Candidatus Eremiobacteraceae bacterium]|nr:isoprenylcysteine carboxylmethyltransferase family protein [Candidatus Eremiobacteraceae bacterium]
MRPLPFSGQLLYALLFWATFGSWILFEFTAARRNSARGASNLRDRGSLRLIAILFSIGLTLAFSLSFLLPRAGIHGNRKLVYFVGIGLMLTGMAVRQHAMSALGRFFTFEVAISTDHTLVQSGLYRYVRHPSYTGALITQLGLGLSLGNWASLLSLLTCIGIAYTYRISVEESALLAALGAPYREYMRRTTRLIPFLF